MTDIDLAAIEAERDRIRSTYLVAEHGRAPSSARGLHHFAVLCSDVEQTVRFYQELLEFPLTEIFENRDYKGSNHFFFDIGNGNLLAFFDFPGLGLQPAEERLGGVQHIAISCEPAQLEQIKARLEQRGIPYLGPDRGVTTSVYFKDPDGIQIEMIGEPLRVMDGRALGE